MKIIASRIKTGNIIFYKQKYLLVIKIVHTKPGKGCAYIQLEMKDIKNQDKISYRFRSNRNIEKIRLEKKIYRFLYEKKNLLILMNQENFEQISINKSLIENQIAFLKEGVKIILEMHDGEVLTGHLPKLMTMMIKKCEPVLKKQTITSSYKLGILNNGIKVMIPYFVNINDKVIINTKELEYIERVMK